MAAIADYVVKDVEPLSVVEGEGFRRLMSVATQGKFKMPSRRYVTETVLPEKFVKLQCEVKFWLKDTQNVSFTTDSWTSRCTDNFTAVTAHLLGSNMQLKCFLLQTSESSESHTSENVAKFLKDLLEAWDMRNYGNMPFTATTDNAANITKGAKEAGMINIR